jgi:hypothetical protein
MRRSVRNTIASYGLLVYGCLLMLVLIISFESEPTGLSYAITILLGIATSFFASFLSGSYDIGIHFWTRLIALFILLTLAQIAIWYLVCEGSFVLKAEDLSL